MIKKVSHVTIIVKDQDQALNWYVGKLGFKKRTDAIFGPDQRFLTVSPDESGDLEIVLQKPDPAMHGKEEAAELATMVGKGTLWVLQTDDCKRMVEQLRKKEVKITSEPEDLPWGTSAIFEDLYGNSFNLVQPHSR